MSRHVSFLSVLRAFAFATAALSLSVAAFPANAQLMPPAASETAKAEIPSDPLERQTPRSSVTGLINALSAENYERAARYFVGTPDPTVLTESEAQSAPLQDADELASRAELARKLEIALDRGGMLSAFAVLSNAADGNLEDGLDPSLEQVGTVRS
jgi:MscS family membrane protein